MCGQRARAGWMASRAAGGGRTSAAVRRSRMRFPSVPLRSSSKSFFRRHSCWIWLAAHATLMSRRPCRAVTQPGRAVTLSGFVVKFSRSATSSLSIPWCPSVPLTETMRFACARWPAVPAVGAWISMTLCSALSLRKGELPGMDLAKG